MPRSYRVVDDANYAYFVTCSVVDWLPLFGDAVYRQIILDSFAYLAIASRPNSTPSW